MAANAITKPDLDKDLEERKKVANDSARQSAPTNGGVRILCGFCNGNGYTDKLQEEQEKLFMLTKDIDMICQENRKLKEKLRATDDEKLELKKKLGTVNDDIKKMNAYAEQFLSAIPLGTTHLKDVGVNTTVAAQDMKEWLLKEAEMTRLLAKQRLRLSGHHSVPMEMWGHSTRAWSKKKAKTFHSNSKSSKQKSSRSPPQPKQTRSYSLPFRPKPLHLLVRKAYLKPVPQPISKIACMEKDTSGSTSWFS